jgi:hypothetical protein
VKRILLAGLAGGIVVFIWGAIAHMALDIGSISMKVAPEAAQQRILSSMGDTLDSAGVYMMPMLQEAEWQDKERVAAASADAPNRPYAFVVYHPQGVDFMARFPRLLAVQALTVILAALLAAWLVSLTTLGYGGRVAVVTSLGVFAWLVVEVPMWNWYRFPLDYTLACLLEQVVGWLLAGLVIAWVVKPKPA